ncbi:MAG: 3-dehydroquinate synthase [Candidatus Riflebacteria bacterium]|nr:3-dehydroquinate synthase [Candidatus Riflebacteria bacterium]
MIFKSVHSPFCRVKQFFGKASAVSRSYDILIGAGAIELFKKVDGRSGNLARAFVVYDEILIDAMSSLRKALRGAGWKVHEIPVQAGESLKEISSINSLYGELLKHGADRHSVLFALGGGTVGDAAGFVAATYLRGISWIGVPTTLLAQVDSAVGGKTGINHVSGKNLIGAFHQPDGVICDLNFLSTLSRREIVSGLGEILKYGLVFDPAFYRSLDKNLERLLARDALLLGPAIQRSLEWKCSVVAQDELDRLGIREVLNFGHTFGHALESITQYKMFQHGEAIIWGMRFALALSEVRGLLSSKKRMDLDSTLARLEIPALPAGITLEELHVIMSKDKKNRGGKLHFVLLDGRAGRVKTDGNINRRHLRSALKLIGGLK